MRTKNNRPGRRPPEQVAVEKTRELVRLLSNDGDAEQALANVQALIASEPLMLMISINRTSGRLSFSTNVAPGTREQDVRLLEDAMRVVQRELGEALVKIAEERGRQEARGRGQEAAGTADGRLPGP